MSGSILIFGANGGIGSATARLLAARGHRLHLAGRNADAVTGLAAELGAGYSIGDVLDDGFIAQAASEAGDRLDGLVYAVGSITHRRIVL